LKEQSPTKERVKFQNLLQIFYQKILSFRNDYQSLKEKGKIKKVPLFERKLLKISKRKTKDQKLQKIYNLIKKYIQNLIYCLRNPEVPPDNNPTKRALRPLVIQRKITGSI